MSLQHSMVFVLLGFFFWLPKVSSIWLLCLCSFVSCILYFLGSIKDIVWRCRRYTVLAGTVVVGYQLSICRIVVVRVGILGRLIGFVLELIPSIFIRRDALLIKLFIVFVI